VEIGFAIEETNEDAYGLREEVAEGGEELSGERPCTRGDAMAPFLGNGRDKETMVTCVMIGGGGGHSCRPSRTEKTSSPWSNQKWEEMKWQN